ncbi:MAG TPA: DinB family protein [Acidimicrobiales bacterium]|nr:DinB family protein [Acidimicrobiales bacterium]
MPGYVCPECGLAYDTINPPDAKVAIRSYPRRYRSALAGALDADEGLVRRRPVPATWSALEYTVHVADLFEEFGAGFERMYEEDKPTITDLWDPDERVVSERYNEQDPSLALERLAAAAEALAKVLDRVDADSWGRTATFPWGERDLLTMTRNAVHEGSHHLRDVERVLESARRR